MFRNKIATDSLRQCIQLHSWTVKKGGRCTSANSGFWAIKDHPCPLFVANRVKKLRVISSFMLYEMFRNKIATDSLWQCIQLHSRTAKRGGMCTTANSGFRAIKDHPCPLFVANRLKKLRVVSSYMFYEMFRNKIATDSLWQCIQLHSRTGKRGGGVLPQIVDFEV